MITIDPSMVLTREEVLSAAPFVGLSASEKSDFWGYFDAAKNLEPDTPDAVSLTEYLQYLQSNKGRETANAAKKTFYLLFLSDRPAAEANFRARFDIHPLSSCDPFKSAFDDCASEINCKIAFAHYSLCLLNHQLAFDLLEWSLGDAHRLSTFFYASMPSASEKARQAAENGVKTALEIFDGDPRTLPLLKNAVGVLRMTSANPDIEIWHTKIGLLQETGYK